MEHSQFVSARCLRPPLPFPAQANMHAFGVAVRTVDIWFQTRQFPWNKDGDGQDLPTITTVLPYYFEHCKPCIVDYVWVALGIWVLRQTILGQEQGRDLIITMDIVLPYPSPPEQTNCLELLLFKRMEVLFCLVALPTPVVWCSLLI